MADLPTYLSLEDADELAEDVILPAAWASASDARKTAALAMASARIDAAYRYQGRKYDLEQAMEFPRVPYPTTSSISTTAAEVGADVWDWDDDEDEAIVPLAVQLAVLHEAGSILAGARATSQQAQHDGLVSQSIGSASESYRQPIAGQAGTPTLCLDADTLMKRYRLRTGALR